MFTIHSKPGCPWCEKAKKAITEEGYSFREITYTNTDEINAFKAQGYKTFPQIYDPDGRYIGGFDNLKEYFDPDDF